MKAESLAAVQSALLKAGFVEHPEHPAYGNIEALSHNGPYEVHGAWTNNDGCVVHLEQNSAQQEDGSTITYPAVLVIENDKGGRVAVSIDDLEAFDLFLRAQGPDADLAAAPATSEE